MGDETLGTQYATALAAKDFDGIRELLHPELEFKGVTPRKAWEASDADSFVEDVLQMWFGEEYQILSLEHFETDAFADRERIGYRFRAREDGEEFLVEQQVFIGQRDGRIDWMRSTCSGFRPVQPGSALA